MQYNEIRALILFLLQLEGVVPHSSGCARTEGYYKLSHKEKRGVLRRPDVFLTEINEKVCGLVSCLISTCCCSLTKNYLIKWITENQNI